jgi:protein-tyrosine phosphatase
MLKRRVLFVCLGNICRSPMAEGVFKHVLKERNLIQYFELDSAGTGAYHIGSNPDPRAVQTCRAKGVVLHHKARQVTKADFQVFDEIFAMDASNYAFLHPWSGQAGATLRLMRDFDPLSANTKDVPDPYYGGIEGFEEVYDMLLRSSHAFIDEWLKENQMTEQ